MEMEIKTTKKENIKIRVTETEICNCDISQLKDVIEKCTREDRLLVENENNIVIKFDKLSFVDTSLKMQEKEYRQWYQKLDKEFPFIPFFLNKESGTLMFFVMGNVEFSIEEQNIIFNKLSTENYITNKKSNVKIFGLAHNINVANALRRLANFQPTPQKTVNLADILSKRGNAAYLSPEQRELSIAILTEEKPKDLKVLSAYYTKEKCPQPFFSVFLENAGKIIPYTIFPLISQKEIDDYLSRKQEIKIIIATKDNDKIIIGTPRKENIKIVTPKELEKLKEHVLPTEPAPQNQPAESEEIPVKTKKSRDRPDSSWDNMHLRQFFCCKKEGDKGGG